jgi:hypothetical protein
VSATEPRTSRFFRDASPGHARSENTACHTNRLLRIGTSRHVSTTSPQSIGRHAAQLNHCPYISLGRFDCLQVWIADLKGDEPRSDRNYLLWWLVCPSEQYTTSVCRQRNVDCCPTTSAAGRSRPQDVHGGSIRVRSRRRWIYLLPDFHNEWQSIQYVAVGVGRSSHRSILRASPR